MDVHSRRRERRKAKAYAKVGIIRVPNPKSKVGHHLHIPIGIKLTKEPRDGKGKGIVKLKGAKSLKDIAEDEYYRQKYAELLGDSEKEAKQ